MTNIDDIKAEASVRNCIKRARECAGTVRNPMAAPQAREAAALDARIYLEEADVLRSKIMGDALASGASVLNNTVTGIQSAVTETNHALADVAAKLAAASEQSSRSAAALVFWTKLMVWAVAAQAALIMVQVVLNLARTAPSG